MSGIELKSAAFNGHAYIPDRHAREGGDVSPPLTWSAVPEGTVELVLLCEDPDAPTGTFLHWLVRGIDPASGGVDAGEPPARGTVRRNGFGEEGWGGPRPPVGDEAHRYFFRLFALSESATLPADVSADDVHTATKRGRLASGTLVGLYQR